MPIFTFITSQNGVAGFSPSLISRLSIIVGPLVFGNERFEKRVPENIEDDDGRDLIYLITSKMPDESAWFESALYDLTPTCRTLLKVASYIGLDASLNIRLGDSVSGICPTRIDGEWGSVEIPGNVWLLAEDDLHDRRRAILADGKAPPVEGPFFYEETGEPITRFSIVAALDERLRYLREWAEHRKNVGAVRSTDLYYRLDTKLRSDDPA